MKKIISVLLSLTLTVLCFSALTLMPASAVSSERPYVIFDANPRNVSETDGADAYPSGVYDADYDFGGNRTKGTSYLKYEGEETPCYVLDFDSASDHDKVLIENGFMCNNGGSNATPGKISSGYMGWLQYPEILRAIKDYVYVSYDVYVEDAQERDITLTVSPMHQYMDPWAKNPQSNCGVFDRFTVTEKNEWISRSVKINSIADAAATADKWTQGDVFFQVSGLGNAALTVKIRNFRLEIKESNHENINTALSEVANIDKKKNFTTYSWSENDPLPDLPKTSEGNNDYFAILTAYNDESEYSQDPKFVIFEADPTRVSNENGASAKPEWALDETHHQWTFGYKTSGVGTVAYGADGQCYNSLITKSYSGNGALLKTGVNSGYTVNGSKMGWMANNKLLAALAPYMEVKYDVCTTVDSYVSIIPLPEDTANDTDPYKDYAVFYAQEVTAGNWVTMSRKGMSKNFTADYGPNWSKGDILVIADNDSAYGQGVKNDVKIRNFRIELSVWDKEEINAALAQVNGIDSIGSFTDGEALGTDANGNRDYFSLLTRFDAASVNSVNAAKGDVNLDTNVNILDLVSLKKYSANGNNHINFKAANCNGDAVFGDSADLDALKQLLLGI